MNGTLAQEWQYAHTYASEGERAAALLIDRHDWERSHSACGGFRRCRVSSVLTTSWHTT